MSSSETHQLICIVCPEGCEMEVTEIDGKLEFPKGICRRGQEYARTEIYDPSRVLTSTVPNSNGVVAMLPVRTAGTIPKPKLMEAMDAIASITAAAPIRIGDAIAENLAETGIALVATRSVDRET